MIKIEISKTLQGKIRKGYPWVFHYQILNQVTGSPGDMGVIYDARNRFLAIGLFDPLSEIRLRVLQTTHPIKIDPEFFRQRLQKALDLRRALPEAGTTGYRIVNGENDGLPGLVLDRYDETLVLKLYTGAWFPYMEILLELIREELPARRCVLRLSREVAKSVAGVRRDGEILFGAPLSHPARFRENHLLFEADVFAGHKTGFFFDQRDNRRHILELSKTRTVLNVFSYTGAFSLYAFAGGCRSVWEIDSSGHALQASLKNLRLNFPDKRFEPPTLKQSQGEAFQVLKELHEQEESFDLVLLDPPAFAGKKKQKTRALKAYTGLAAAGARLVRDGGVLFAASCSAHVAEEEFFRSVAAGIKTTGKNCEEILRTDHACDHPVTFAEGQYLKAVYLQFGGK